LTLCIVFIQAEEDPMQEALFVIIVGSSGVGKSVLLRASLQAHWPPGLEIQIPRKHTTRISRGPEELLELEHVDRPQFDLNRAGGTYLVTYESYEELYGFPRASFPEQPPTNIVFLQAAPSASALQLVQALGSRYKVRICALEAPGAVVRQRLAGRPDEETARSLKKRTQGLSEQRHRRADFTIDASASAESVFATFKGWLIQQWQLCKA
jgi:ribose 1,5-bisphosphokinase PhnN